MRYATCHPKRKYKAKGLCVVCYDRQLLSFRRRRYRLRKYGLSLSDYESMYKNQSGLCAICKNPPLPMKPLHVDHNHATGKVRALLCSRCNNGIGHFEEKVELLEQAIVYLKTYNNTFLTHESPVALPDAVTANEAVN